MGVNLYNSAGYLDPTAYQALTNIENEEKMKRRLRKINKHKKKTKNYVHFDKSIKTGGIR